MAKEDISRLLEESKLALDGEHKAFAESIRKDLDSFKKKALSRV